jgi:hypothetical protein
MTNFAQQRSHGVSTPDLCKSGAANGGLLIWLKAKRALPVEAHPAQIVAVATSAG